MVASPRCAVCGKHLEHEEDVKCHDCSGTKRHFECGVALYEYKSINDSIFAFKNRQRPEYGRFYGSKMAEYLGPTILKMKPDLIIPVPISAAKERSRGYNQSEILAGYISEGTGIPVAANVVKRRENGKAQKKLDRLQRQNNIKKAFHIAQNDVKLKTVLVVDDVYTTGATIDAVASVLKEAGAAKVCFVTLAIGHGM